MTAPTRPVLRYHGGKWRLAPWILSFFPPHRCYVEPFGGAASVLIRKERSYAEVYNDLEGDVVTMFRVLREPEQSEQLRRAVEMTPFARAEFVASYEPSADPVEIARRLIVRSFMGFGSASTNRLHQTGFRANCNRSGTTPAHDWNQWPGQIAALSERLRGVVIESLDARVVIGRHDAPATLIYADPPYVWSTRGERHVRCYTHEMADDDHRALAACLRAACGMVVLSGYPCDLYDRELFPDWERHERAHRSDGAHARTEVVWLNPACSAALAKSRSQHDLGVGGAA